MAELSHENRIRQELLEAGITKYGLKKMSTRYLPNVINEDEHIGGVVYGRCENALAMLVATDRRVVYVGRRPLYSTVDEVNYSVVSGIKMSTSGLVATVTLHTRVKDYVMKYANLRCARMFVNFIDQKIIKNDVEVFDHPEMPRGARLRANRRRATGLSKTNSNENVQEHISKEGFAFLQEHNIGVISTIDRDGLVFGAAVYYAMYNNYIYLLTKSETKKARNILANKHASFTITDEEMLRTLQLTATAEIETDQLIKDYIFEQLTKPRSFNSRVQLPPVVQLHEGSFTIIRLSIKSARYSDYNQ
jgi:general stress protein 26